MKSFILTLLGISPENEALKATLALLDEALEQVKPKAKI